MKNISAIIVVALCLLVAFLTVRNAGEQPKAVTTEQKLEAPFSLVNQEGKTVTDKDFPGYKLVYFGFTSCPEICPLGLKKIAKATESIGSKKDKLNVIFITTDPERDTPATLKQYLESFKPTVISGLTGQPEQISDVEKKYGVYAQKVEDPAVSDYMMNHSTIIYFIGPDNTLLDLFGNDTPVDSIAKALQQKII